MAAPKTFALETYAARSVEYYTNLVDADGLPYFNVFLDPPQAVHDWPDFGDVMSRQLQGVAMARLMTGRRAPIEECWRSKVLALIDPATGLLTRPQTNFSDRKADPGDACLTLYALCTLYEDQPSDELRGVIDRMAGAMLAFPLTDKMGSGFFIKSLMVAARITGREDLVAHAGKIVQGLLGPGGFLPPDNTFPPNAHMHITLRGLVGTADWAVHTGDRATLERVAALYEFVRAKAATRFGFVCESFARKGDIILCETCTIMDLIGVATTLANHGYEPYWADVERFTRNHLVESQVTDGSWLGQSDQNVPDTHQVTCRDLPRRVVGAYAGWSSPTHILAARETMIHWGGPEIRGKVRALQNCCGGSGTHAFFIAWKNAARFESGVLSVHMHIDKLLPQAEIRGFQPYQGKLAITLRQDCSDLRVRRPEFVAASQVRASVQEFEGTRPLSPREQDGYLHFGPRRSGATLLLEYPLEFRTEEFAIGNEGYRQYPYRATWKGNTVVRMEPLGPERATGFSDFDQREIPIYYGRSGPGPLYQREAMVPDQAPQLSELGMDRGACDHWRIPAG